MHSNICVTKKLECISFVLFLKDVTDRYKEDILKALSLLLSCHHVTWIFSASQGPFFFALQALKFVPIKWKQKIMPQISLSTCLYDAEKYVPTTADILSDFRFRSFVDNGRLFSVTFKKDQKKKLWFDLQDSKLCLNYERRTALCTGSYLDDNLYHKVQLLHRRGQKSELTLVLDEQETGFALNLNNNSSSKLVFQEEVESVDIAEVCMTHLVINGLLVQDLTKKITCKLQPQSRMTFTSVSFIQDLVANKLSIFIPISSLIQFWYFKKNHWRLEKPWKLALILELFNLKDCY